MKDSERIIVRVWNEEYERHTREGTHEVPPGTPGWARATTATAKRLGLARERVANVVRPTL